MRFEMPVKPILIKKYENRRLYDVTNSRYVNLEEVAQLLRKGHEVAVVDAASGKDITRLVLTQIIIEDAKTPDSAFPLDLLRQMIITSGRASQETALRYMKAMLDFYHDSYRAISPAINPFGMFPPGFEGSTDADTKPTSVRPAESESGTRRPAEVDELKQRVAELERLVSSGAGNKQGQPRRSVRHPKARR